MTLNKQACPICTNSDTRIFNNSRYFYRSFTDLENNNLFNNNYLCNYCGHIWQYPKPSKDELSNLYNKQYRLSTDKVTYKNKVCRVPLQLNESKNSFLRARGFFNVIEKSNIKLMSKGSFLDIGGYQGLFAWAISDLTGLKAKVVDYNLKGLEFASSFLGIESEKIEIDIIDTLKKERKSSYALVSMIHSLEHTSEPQNIIKSCSEILKVNGYLYIEVPNSSGSGLNDPTHLHTFSLESMDYLLKINNFEIIYLNSLPLAHDAVEELQNSNVVIRALCKKIDLKYKINNNIINLKYKKNKARQINLKLTMASIITIYLMFKKLIYNNFLFLVRLFTWIIFDYLPGSKKLYKLIKKKLSYDKK